jgi:hypothetical protein
LMLGFLRDLFQRSVRPSPMPAAPSGNVPAPEDFASPSHWSRSERARSQGRVPTLQLNPDGKWTVTGVR